MGWTVHKHTDVKHRKDKNGAGGRVGGGGGEEVMTEWMARLDQAEHHPQP